MKFGLYLSTHSRDIWRSQYINYKELKKILKQVLVAPYAVYVPTKLSTPRGTRRPAAGAVQRHGPLPVSDPVDSTPQEHFFVTLENEVARLDAFVKNVASQLRSSLAELQASISHADLSDSNVKDAFMDRAKELSNEYLHLEKFVNLNYAALQKILKKHDKMLPNVPCFTFYMSHISSQPWVRGEHQDLQVTLTRIFSMFYLTPGVVDVSMMEHNHEEHTRRFWVRPEDLYQVKHTFLQHLPASDVAQPEDSEDDWSIVNHVVLDNSSLEMYHSLLYGRPYCLVVRLRWRGMGSPTMVQVQRKTYKEGWRPEASIKDSFPLVEEKVSDFLQGRWTFADARKFLMQHQQEQQEQERPRPGGSSLFDAAGNTLATPTQSEAERVVHEYNLFKTFTEVQRLVESKSLQPMVRLMHRETVFEEAKVPGMAGHFSVQIQEDVEVLLEYSYDGMYRLANGLWLRESPADRIVLPYAVVLVHCPSNMQTPAWLQDLMDRRFMVEVHDFSKMLFGIAGLMPDMVRAVPVWIDDPLIQRVLYANVLEHGAANSDTLPPQFASAASTYFVDEGSLLQQEAAGMLEAYPSEGGPAVSPKVQWGQAPGPDMQNGGSSKTLFGIAGWQAKLAERVRNNVYQSRSQIMFEEADHYMQNERMLLTWLRLAILVGGLAVIMLGFAAKSYSDPTELPSIHISEVTAFVLLLCAICICSYGIGVFLWRGSKMYQQRPRRYDDTVGTLWLNLLMIFALLGLFLVNVADLMENLDNDADDDNPRLL